MFFFLLFLFEILFSFYRSTDVQVSMEELAAQLVKLQAAVNKELYAPAVDEHVVTRLKRATKH